PAPILRALSVGIRGRNPSLEPLISFHDDTSHDSSRHEERKGQPAIRAANGERAAGDMNQASSTAAMPRAAIPF
ncbi:MAG TPA: hypothetical protein VOA41_20990, partial [Candidatus Dormibacteraeota bacterium]|nr:hypothetical protein [Candidatus Dormibacteraeota bacterium]